MGVGIIPVRQNDENFLKARIETMRNTLKKYAGILYIAGMAVVILVVLRCTNELAQVYEAMQSLNSVWLGACAGCIVAYLLLRMGTLRYYLWRNGVRLSWLDAAGVTGAGQLYSAITPSSSGGQPMQVFWLHRRGVPVSLGTACVSVKFMGFQTAFLLLGGVLWLSNWQMVTDQLYGFRWLVLLGCLINLALIAGVALTIPRFGAVERLIQRLIRLAAKIHLVKHPDAACARAFEAVSDYRQALQSLLRSPLDAAVIFLLSMLQVLAYMGVSLCLYRAFGLSGTPDVQILTLQLLLFIAAAFVPLPGAAGAQETGFCLFFRNVFPSDQLIAAMLCWRFFSYYALMILGLILMALSGMRKPSGREGDFDR